MQFTTATFAYRCLPLAAAGYYILGRLSHTVLAIWLLRRHAPFAGRLRPEAARLSLPIGFCFFAFALTSPCRQEIGSQDVHLSALRVRLAMEQVVAALDGEEAVR